MCSKLIKFIFIVNSLINNDCIASETTTGAEVETVPVIGTHPSGNSVVVEVPRSEYIKRFSASAATVNDSMIVAIESNQSKMSQWHLRTIGVGLGVNMEFGIGIYKIGALPRVRLLFTNSTNPPLP